MFRYIETLVGFDLSKHWLASIYPKIDWFQFIETLADFDISKQWDGFDISKYCLPLISQKISQLRYPKTLIDWFQDFETLTTFDIYKH